MMLHTRLGLAWALGALLLCGCTHRDDLLARLLSGGQELSLSASIEGSGGGYSRAPIIGQSFADGSHSFGIVVTKADGVTAYETGSGNILAQAEVLGASQTWSYKWGTMSVAGSVLPMLYGGEPMELAAYYPYDAAAAGLADRDEGRVNVPFDLSGDRVDQQDVLYSLPQAVSYTDGSRLSVPLLFQHVYALLEFQVKLKDATVGATITKVEVCNKEDKDFLKNKGWFSPYTGAVTVSTKGNVSFTTTAELDATSYETIRVMVPPTLLAAYADGDIYVQMYDNGSADPKQFPILRNYLTQSGTYGLVSGGKYSFKLLYDNMVYGSITVMDWNSTIVDPEPIGNEPPPYIEIDGLRWVTGNLVASGNNSCKVGKPTDCGLYFKFGSLVGWSGGANGDGVGSSSAAAVKVKVKPATYGGSDVWGTVGYYTGAGVPGPGTNYCLPATDDPTMGIGDPCRYYLGAPWRMPTAAEYLTLLGAAGGNTEGGVVRKVKGYDLYFTTTGYLTAGYGAIGQLNGAGYCWSSSVHSDANGWCVAYYDGIAYVPVQFGRENGLPARCVW